MSKNLTTYLRIIAKKLIEDPEADELASLNMDQEIAWDNLSRPEQDQANEIVEAVFGEWV